MYFVLHLVAMITMLIDHLGCSIFPEYDVLRVIGRIAFPLYAYFVVSGFYHTSNRKKYFKRFLVLALLSEYPYDIIHFGTWKFSLEFLTNQNVCITLALGLLAMMLTQKLQEKYKSLWISVLPFTLAAIAASMVRSDYMFVGIFLIYCYYVAYRTNKDFVPLASLPYLFLNIFGSEPGEEWRYLTVIVSIILLFQYNNKPVKIPKWFKVLNQVFYPLHLSVLAGLTLLLH
jgi:hypothetical protein